MSKGSWEDAQVATMESRLQIDRQGNTLGLVGPGNRVIPLVSGPSNVPVLAPPSSVLALAQNAGASVSWTMKDLSASSFIVTAWPGGAIQSVAANGNRRGSCVFTGLQNGVGYTFTVQAKSPLGISPASAASNKVTPSALPASVLPVTRGLEFWWSAGQVAGMSNGAPVNTLTDFSGNGYDAAVMGDSGVWVGAWSSGKPAVSINAAGKYTNFNTNASGLMAGLRGPDTTLYVLYDVTANPSANSGATGGRVVSQEGPNGLVNLEDTGGGFALGIGSNAGQAGGEVYDMSQRYTGATISAPDIALATPIRATITKGLDAAGNAGGLRINGGAVAGVVSGTLAKGMPWTFGCMYAGGYNKYMTGRLAEILIFAAVHGADEIAAVEGYLATRT